MGGGIFRGMFWGTVVSALTLAAVSLSTPLPPRPDAVPEVMDSAGEDMSAAPLPAMQPGDPVPLPEGTGFNLAAPEDPADALAEPAAALPEPALPTDADSPASDLADADPGTALTAFDSAPAPDATVAEPPVGLGAATLPDTAAADPTSPAPGRLASDASEPAAAPEPFAVDAPTEDSLAPVVSEDDSTGATAPAAVDDLSDGPVAALASDVNTPAPTPDPVTPETDPAAAAAAADAPAPDSGPEPAAPDGDGPAVETAIAEARAAEIDPVVVWSGPDDTPAVALDDTLADPAAAAPSGTPNALRDNAVPFDASETRPLLAVVLIDEPEAGLPLDVLTNFSFPVAFAINPFRADAAERANAYRAAGFEVVITGDILPDGATAEDVLTALTVAQQVLPEAVALLDTPEGRIQGDREVLDATVATLSETGHGLVAFPSATGTAAEDTAARVGLPAATLFRLLDDEGQRATVITRFLGRAGFAAADEGHVVVAGRTRPDTITALLSWSLANRSEALAIAPLSAVLLRASGG